MEINNECFIKILKQFVKQDIEDNWETNLGDLGIDSMASIEVLLEIEENYNISFPDELLTADTFSSAKSLWESLELLLVNEGSENEGIV
ncbi:acyl carrier protein [Rossellomorea vietnamensis]|uniref:Acyl carrier protein n=1 Tax=Rossellomorea vietnamensis TaxID=218284 RepID=A0A6I6UCY2_9BACI|nr:phosphopantetheine-binding protein [Rossellomorea vietnamensis]QHE59798.1 acyl carrier protein [Rossellomorea vietnamensis]